MLDRTFLIWADASKNLSSGMAGLDSLHKFYLDILYGNTVNREHLERLFNPKIKKNRGIAREKFDIVSFFPECCISYNIYICCVLYILLIHLSWGNIYSFLCNFIVNPAVLLRFNHIID